MLGLSASHLGHLRSDDNLRYTVAIEHRVKAIGALSATINKGLTESLGDDERDAILATIQILLLHDVS